MELAVSYAVNFFTVNKLREWIIKHKYKRLVTLSPLTPMATHFHISNGAKQIHINDETQNFEYKL